MIARVSEHSGYIEILTENGDKHSQVGRDIGLIGWGPDSYACQWGSTRHVTIYDPRGNKVNTLSINPEWTNLRWSGKTLTYRSGSMICTMDANGRLIDSRPY